MYGTHGIVLDVCGWLRNAAKLKVKHPDAGE